MGGGTDGHWYRGAGVWDQGVTEGMQGHIPWFMDSFLSALNTGKQEFSNWRGAGVMEHCMML